MKKLILIIAIFCAALSLRAQNPPVAVADSYIPYTMGVYDTTFIFNVLQNDYDPDGDEIRIYKVEQYFENEIMEYTNFMNNQVYYHYLYADLTEKKFRYKVCEIDDTTSISKWADLFINPGISYDAPVARNDTVYTTPGYDVCVNVLSNDYDITQDSLFFNGSHCSDSMYRITCDFTGDVVRKGWRTQSYFLSDNEGKSDMGQIHIIIDHNKYFDTLDINNITAEFICTGHHNKFFAPRNTGITCAFFGKPWIAGYDTNDSLHFAGKSRGPVWSGYWHGPVSDTYDSLYDSNWYNIWKLHKSDIDYHKSHWGEPGYEPINEILTWPGNGNISQGQANNLAPFHDKNDDDIYDPYVGDYPKIRGDQCLFFIFNDDRFFTNINNQHIRKLGVEVHAMIYAFAEPSDSALGNTLFMHYKIINRSDTNYYNTNFGFYSDMDIGNPFDDYIGSNIQGGYFYGYNGDSYDEDYYDFADTIFGYKYNLGSSALLFIGGALLDADSTDNLLNQCDFGVNGLNFGDTIIDNERLGLTNFLGFTYGGVTGRPNSINDFYQNINCHWKDGTPLMYGGEGHPDHGSVGPECRFLYPSDSDTCNWGTNGELPNGGFNQNGYFWDETTLGINSKDYTGLGISGPFTLKAGQTQIIDMAYVFARSYDTTINPLDILEDRCAQIKQMFEYEEGFFSSTEDIKTQTKDIVVYPNPSNGYVFIKGLSPHQYSTYRIFNLYGETVRSGEINNSSHAMISLSGLRPGYYLLRIETDSRHFCKKVLVR